MDKQIIAILHHSSVNLIVCIIRFLNLWTIARLWTISRLVDFSFVGCVSRFVPLLNWFLRWDGWWFLSRKHYLCSCEIGRRVHLFKYTGHALLGLVFLLLSFHLSFGDCCLFVTLLKFLVCEEVLSHDSADFFEIVKNSQASILHFLLRWAEAAVCTVHVKGECRGCPTKYDLIISCKLLLTRCPG